MSLNKDYYDVLSKQTKDINTTFQKNQVAFKDAEYAEEKKGDEPAYAAESTLPDLESLFFPSVEFDSSIVN